MAALTIEKIKDEDLEILTISDISRITKLSRGTIREAMDLYQNSNGVFGLKCFTVDSGNRRLSTRPMVRSWYEERARRNILGTRRNYR